LIKVEADRILVSGRSNELIASLNKLRSRADIGPHILDVRGLGLMIGVEFASPSSVSAHDPNTLDDAPKNLASRVTKRCLEKGMLILTTSIYEVVRFIPPLNISAEEMAKGIDIFTQAVEEVVKEG
jgi:4-aminobutyrate aminotransferase